VQAEPFAWVHCPHAPHTSQAGVAPLQSASEAHALQTPPVHTGVSPPQSAPVRHCTQLFVVLAQRGVTAGHWLSRVQTTQSPELGPVVAHSGLAPLQSLAVQARHARLVASQIGVAPEQSVFARQPTQLFVGTSQTGVVPVHAV
jgi:hypothetical protein